MLLSAINNWNYTVTFRSRIKHKCILFIHKNIRKIVFTYLVYFLWHFCLFLPPFAVAGLDICSIFAHIQTCNQSCKIPQVTRRWSLRSLSMNTWNAQDATHQTPNFVTTTITIFPSRAITARIAEGIGLKVALFATFLWVVAVAKTRNACHQNVHHHSHQLPIILNRKSLLQLLRYCIILMSQGT